LLSLSLSLSPSRESERKLHFAADFVLASSVARWARANSNNHSLRSNKNARQHMRGDTRRRARGKSKKNKKTRREKEKKFTLNATQCPPTDGGGLSHFYHTGRIPFYNS